MSYSDDFLQGQRDCIKGIPHESGKSDAYNDGYKAQYDFDQVRDNLTVKQNEQSCSQMRV